MKSKQKEKSLEDAIIDLYINIKKDEHMDKYDDKMALHDREKLKKLDSLIIVDYIKTSMEILVNLKVKRQIEEFMLEIENRGLHSDAMNEYEELLRQSEATVRNHIRIQHQMKLHSENLKFRIEELEKSKSELKKTLKILQEQLNLTSRRGENDNHDRKEKEIKLLNCELENMKTILNSYENQNLKITELEMKIRTLNSKHEKEMKNLKEKYQEEISYLNKIINSYEDVLKVRNIQSKQNGIPNIQQNKENKGKNYIEEEEEITHYNFERLSNPISNAVKPKSRGQSPITREKEDFCSNSKRIHSKIEAYKMLIENKMSEMNRELSRNSSNKPALRRNHSNEYNEDFINGLKYSPEKGNPLTKSDQNTKVVINKLNLNNLAKLNTNNGSNHTDRSNSARKSNYNSQNSHRSSNNTGNSNYSSNNNLKYRDIKDHSPSFSPDIGGVKVNRQPGNDANIRDYIYAKLNKSKSNSKLNMNVQGVNHVRSKSGYTLNYY